MENIRIIISFIVACVCVFVFLKKNMTPALALLLSGLICGVVAGIPMGTIATTISASFGTIMKLAGLPILFGVIFGQFLSVSGGLSRLATSLVRRVGPDGSIFAIYIYGYLISIPINFIPAAAITMPLVKSLPERTKKPITAYACAFATASFLTTATVIPTLTPLTLGTMAELNMASFALWGVLLSFPVSLVGSLGCALYLAKRHGSIEKVSKEDLAGFDEVEDTPTPGLTIGLILVPIVLILVGAILPYILAPENTLCQIFTLIGNPSVALLISILVEMAALKKYLPKPAMKVFEDGVAAASTSMVIVGAASIFGDILLATGLNTLILGMVDSLNISVLLLTWLIAIIMRAAIGIPLVVGTALIPLLLPVVLETGVSPVLFVLCLCFAAVGLIVPTDSSFWLYKEGMGLTTKETFIAITIPGTIMSVLAIILIMIVSQFTGVLPGMF